ncbi:hypothetical protein PISMIDRAFT_119009 [Pisolithus microcarpus 441]|uniref:DEAD/DEAH box helicase domain-containing protein n=1 Tax=Pisolithus microcarpus 441 TaxID=765257 RepID=A0A0C9YSS6_9AGAM|nr:hypothetical protein BKA83DRAFT_119009 [Pisolithus microcarpus]KIK13382.1 hypothetical protein PISMIDRAFT_119009 [Pisolithus microcarpus 441]
MVLPAPNQDIPGHPCTPTLSEIWHHVQDKFGICPCHWQLKVTEALLNGDNDIVCIAGTGMMGKTLGFWIPILFCPGGIQIVVTLLNTLGRQNVASLARAGIKAIAINAETATPANFSVSLLTNGSKIIGTYS